jgi:RNA polymerase sigma-70 factor (ECF subfamily)
VASAMQPQVSPASPMGTWGAYEVLFCGLYRQHGVLVRREIRRCAQYVGNEELKDLEQEIWRAAWRGLARFEGRAAPSTWLISITRHVVYSWLRHERVKQLAQEKLWDWGACETTAGSGDGSETTLLERSSLVEALRRLDPRFAEVIRLRYFEQLSDTEAARRLSLPLGTIKGRLRSGLRHLGCALTH